MAFFPSAGGFLFDLGSRPSCWGPLLSKGHPCRQQKWGRSICFFWKARERDEACPPGRTWVATARTSVTIMTVSRSTTPTSSSETSQTCGRGRCTNCHCWFSSLQSFGWCFKRMNLLKAKLGWDSKRQLQCPDFSNLCWKILEHQLDSQTWSPQFTQNKLTWNPSGTKYSRLAKMFFRKLCPVLSESATSQNGIRLRSGFVHFDFVSSFLGCRAHGG